MIFDQAKGKYLRGYNDNSLYIPASVTKIPTTVAALNILGPEYRFKTFLNYTGSIGDGILHGDLYLRGTGDPFLTASDLMNMVEHLKRKGVRKVAGRFVFDQSFMTSKESIGRLGGASATYNSGVGALSSEFNRIHLEWEPSEEPGVTNMISTPALPFIQLGLSREELQPEHKILYESSPVMDMWLLSQTAVSESGQEDLPVKKPGLFTAQLFRKLCQQSGIELPLPEEGFLPAKNKTVYVHRSQPLMELAESLLEYSNNLMSELLLLATARKLTGKALLTEDAAKAVGDWFKQKIPETDWSGFFLENGSGLSSANRVSPQQMIAILKFADSKMLGDRSYLSMLPIAGWKGTLRKRMNTPETAFRVWAKTGTINYSSGLAGYFFTENGKKLLFAIFVTDFAKRSESDSMLGVGSAPDLENAKVADGWITKARDIQDELLAKWIREFK